MILAWLSASDIIISFSLNKVSYSPPLASKQEVYKMVSSLDKKVEIIFSSFLWIFWVPQINLTELKPKPHLSKACLADWTISGWFDNPK